MQGTPTTHPNSSAPNSEQDRSACWIERGGLKVKIVAGTPPAEIEEMIDRAADAWLRLAATRSDAEAIPTSTASHARGKIEHYLAEHGHASAAELAAGLGLSSDNVRVTLRRMQQAGRVRAFDEGGVRRFELQTWRDPRLDQ